jgi:hypothetical protein
MISCSCLIGVPLAYMRGSNYLMLLGVMTFLLILQAWWDIYCFRLALKQHDTARATQKLRWHLINMGASYIGAWSGFFANNFIFGVGEWQIWFYAMGPTVIGAVVIARVAMRLPMISQVPYTKTTADALRE